MPTVNGMPEGLELVRIGAPKEDDFSLVGDRIVKGVIANAASGVIVKPVEGYTLQPARAFDIREYKFVDGPPNEFTVVKALKDPVMIKVSGEFVLTNSADQDVVKDALGKLSSLPGCSGVTIE